MHSVGVLKGAWDLKSVKPRKEVIAEAKAKEKEQAAKAKVVCTFEDHVLSNGFGASVIELLHDSDIHTKVERIGWPDEFVEHGKVDILRKLHGVTVENAVDKVSKHF